MDGSDRLIRAAEEAFQTETGHPPRTPYTPMTYGKHTHSGWYYPPVPCTEVNSVAYHPEWVDMELSPESYELWMPALGEGPPPRT